MGQLATYQFEGANFKVYYDDSNNVLHVLDMCHTIENGCRSVTNTAELIERKFVEEINEDVRLFLYGTDNLIAEFSTRGERYFGNRTFMFLHDTEGLIYRPFVKEMYEINESFNGDAHVYTT